MLTVEERVDRVEMALSEFMTQTSTAIAQTNASLAQTDASLAQTNAAVDRMERAIERYTAEGQRERRELNRQLGEISNRIGTIVEDVIAPSLRRMAREELDCGELESFAIRIERRHALTRRRREFDVVVVGDSAVLLNQTKTTARPEYAAEFVQFLQSGEFYHYFPECAGKPLIPVFSALYLPEDIVTFLTRNAVYAVAMGEEALEVINLQEVRGITPPE